MNKREAQRELKYLYSLNPGFGFIYFLMKKEEDPDYWTKVREIAFGKESEVNGQKESA
jgi:hypothetical protein